jgi:hypothetical protein
MDDSTKTMMLTLATGVIKKGLMTLGATAATHGIIASNQIETFVAAGLFLVGAGWSFWNDYGKAIVLSKLEVLKAQSLAQAAKLRNAGLPQPTVTEIVAQHPTLKPADITKVADTVVKVLIAAVLLSAFLFVPPASAQTNLRPKLPIDPLGLNDRPIIGKSGGPLEDIVGALDAKLLPDLQYALKLATASGSKVTAPCYQAWIDIINVRQKAVQGPDGQDMAMPDPAIVTKFEKMVELRNSLQPDSDFMIKCSPVASMVKKDIIGFIGIVLSGGAGLATLVPGL